MAILASFDFGILLTIIAGMLLAYYLNKRYPKLVRKTISVLCLYVVPLVLVVKMVYLGGVIHDGAEVWEHGKTLGYTAVWLLFLILLAKPTWVIGRDSKWKFLAWKASTAGYVVGFRKELGILTFWLAFAHYIGYLSLWLTGALPLSTYLNTTIVVGLIALFALFIGFLTSNIYSIKLLKKNWKRVQMIAYPALFFTILHIYFINPTSGTVLFVLFGIYAVMKGMEWKGVKL